MRWCNAPYCRFSQAEFESEKPEIGVGSSALVDGDIIRIACMVAQSSTILKLELNGAKGSLMVLENRTAASGRALAAALRDNKSLTALALYGAKLRVSRHL